MRFFCTFYIASPMCLHMIAARVSKPCSVIRAARAPTGLTTYPPRICPHSAAPYPGVGECEKAHALSAPPNRMRRTRRTIGCRLWRVSKWPAPHVLADSTVGPEGAARVSKPRHGAHATRTACPPAHTRQSWCARLSPESIRLACRLRTAGPPAQDVQQTESGPEKAARGVCALPRPPPLLCVPPHAAAAAVLPQLGPVWQKNQIFAVCAVF